MTFLRHQCEDFLNTVTQNVSFKNTGLFFQSVPKESGRFRHFVRNTENGLSTGNTVFFKTVL